MCVLYIRYKYTDVMYDGRLSVGRGMKDPPGDERREGGQLTSARWKCHGRLEMTRLYFSRR